MAQAQAAVAASVRAITNREVTGDVQSLDELTRALDATGVNLTWDEAEKRAVALLNLGAPVEARRLYERAPSTLASSALRHCRIADACLAALCSRTRSELTEPPWQKTEPPARAGSDCV